MAQRDVVFPQNRQALYELNGYSAAVRANGFLFVSGQVGSREDGSPEPDFADQVQLAFDNLQSVLEAAGASFDDILDVTTFHTDPETQLAVVMEAKRRAFPGKPYPAWTAVGVNWLAGFDFEIKVIAKVPG
ncbi:RidA family protein [Vreelandella sp. EE22]